MSKKLVPRRVGPFRAFRSGALASIRFVVGEYVVICYRELSTIHA